MQVVHPIYCLPPIWWFHQALKEDTIFVSESTKYQRQTYYNRLIIPAPNNIQKLSIPVVKRGKGLPINKVEISYDTDWQSQHWKSLKTAYGNSAFWEYYNYILEPVYLKKYKYLIDFNLDLLKIVLTLFDIDKKIVLVSHNISLLKHPKDNTKYHQMFAAKYGFTEDASILDLLFNLGKEGVFLLKLKT